MFPETGPKESKAVPHQHRAQEMRMQNSPIGKLLNAFIGEGPFCSSGVVWGRTFSRKDFMEG